MGVLSDVLFILRAMIEPTEHMGFLIVEEKVEQVLLQTQDLSVQLRLAFLRQEFGPQ